MGTCLDYTQLIEQLENEKLDALLQFGDTERTEEIFRRNDKKLDRLYGWLYNDLIRGSMNEDLVKRANY
jgi:hypothetical protein